MQGGSKLQRRRPLRRKICCARWATYG